MEISVEGLRTSVADWEAVRNIPENELPKLTPQQEEVANKMHILREDYARSVLAGQKTTRKLLEKTERFARLLQRTLTNKMPQATVGRVTLNTWEGRFEVSVEIDGTSVPLRISEDTVDDFLEGGSADAGQTLTRILETSLQEKAL